MRIILFAVLLAILATTAFAQKKHCIDRDFTVTSILVEPAQKYDDYHIIYFSADTNKQRIDVNEMDPEVKTYSIYQRYDQGKLYIYDKQTQKCVVHPLQGQLTQYCLAQNATHTGQVTIGGSLKADVWEETVYGHRLRIILSSFQEIPINIFSRGGTHKGLVMQEWIDFKHGVESDSIFDVPPACNQQGPARLLTTRNNAGIPVRRLMEKVNALTMPFVQH
jgi:hypothetical protein